jgi:riboflavin kinase/FMN adenylyltransferase
MRLLRNLDKNTDFNSGSVVAIGNFDGVHLGHQHLLKNLREKATYLNLPMVVVIFEPQASEFFKLNLAPPRLTQFRDKFSILKQLKVDYVLCVRFNQNFANTSPLDFMIKILKNRLNTKYLLIGDDFKFGKNRIGDFDLLTKYAIENNFEVARFSEQKIKGLRISSTAVREALKRADFKMAHNLLGREYSISGRVIYGKSLGKTFGVPTANINLNKKNLALTGVYCVRVKKPDGSINNGVANIGNRPTVSGLNQVLEVHLFDTDENLYGKKIEVFFLHKLRDEVKFPNIDILIANIKRDVTLAKQFFLE